MPLTSQIKELGAILQKLIKYEPGLIQADKNDKHWDDRFDGDADEPLSCDVGRGLGATNGNENCSLTRTRTNIEKNAGLNSVWLKEVIKSYDTN